MSTPRPRTAVIAVGRATFDLEWARARVDAAVELLGRAGADVVYDGHIVVEPDDVEAVVATWSATPDLVVVLQGTFTDARFVAGVRAASSAPLGLWAFPEHRGGGRLRSNSLCGMILASYALADEGVAARWLYLDPDAHDAPERVGAWLGAPAPDRPEIGGPPAAAELDPADRQRAQRLAQRLSTAAIGVIGDPPPGFTPCEVGERAAGAGVVPDVVPIGAVLERAEAAAVDVEVAGVGLSDRAARAAVGLEVTLADVARRNDWDALAYRCWPETFDVLGCAACAALAWLNEDGLPAACEADALGAWTMLALRELASSPPFLADLVDIDVETDTAALWHCGVAPRQVAAPGTVEAGDHPNRGVPLVQRLALKPGVATVARLSQSRGSLRLAVGRVEVVDAPCPYEGSAGVVRFSRPVDEVLATIVDEGLEHHLALVYGDIVGFVRALAAELGLPVVEL